MLRPVPIAALVASLAAPALAQSDPDTLMIAQSVDIESLEPDMLNVSGSINVASHIWGTLLSVTPEGEIVPNFATGWEWNEAGNEISFPIREGLELRGRRGADGRGRGLQPQPRRGSGERVHRPHAWLRLFLDRVRGGARRG